MVLELFGTSIPINDFPGIGASILTDPVDEAKAKARFSCKLAILDTLVTDLGLKENCVTEEPTFTSSMSTSIPNDLRVSLIIFERISISEVSGFSTGGSTSNSKEGVCHILSAKENSGVCGAKEVV